MARRDARIGERWSSPAERPAGFATRSKPSTPSTVPLGEIVWTLGARQVMSQAGHIPPEFLLRHKHADWGDLDPEDKQEIDQALKRGGRVFSAYTTRTGERLWVVTESDRSVTTLLLPQEH